MKKAIKFNATREDAELIRKITARFLALCSLHGAGKPSPLHVEMDITAVHLNGNPLRLNDLLLAEDADFIHDVCGIAKYLNRNSGKLSNCFFPRFSAHTDPEKIKPLINKILAQKVEERRKLNGGKR